MKDEEFNRYCAEVMGNYISYDIAESGIWRVMEVNGQKVKSPCSYNPATDLNQMAEVFDKLWLNYYDEYSTSPSLNMGDTKSIAKAMRDFIESTNEK